MQGYIPTNNDEFSEARNLSQADVYTHILKYMRSRNSQISEPHFLSPRNMSRLKGGALRKELGGPALHGIL